MTGEAAQGGAAPRADAAGRGASTRADVAGERGTHGSSPAGERGTSTRADAAGERAHEASRDAASEPPARPGEFAPLQLGPLRVWPPVVLAPMAGVTNYPFRALCRRFGAGLYVSEMITARPLVRGDAVSRRLADFGPGEAPRSLQLYGVDPADIGAAVRWLVGEGRVDHIDLNFGCPVRKVTRKGGGAAIPVKRQLLRAIVRAAVQAAGGVPVTMKFRIGIDDALVTFETAGRIGEDEGCAAVGLHARTAAQGYSGAARWAAIARLKQVVTCIPVLGNGDIWEADDALRMMRTTGCDGVIVGRGCLGRPWLFRELAAVFRGEPPPPAPALGEVLDTMLAHAAALCEFMSEGPAMRAFRKHIGWYTLGFALAGVERPKLMQVQTLAELRALVARADRDEPFPPGALRAVRGKGEPLQTVVLPHGYLDDLDDATPPADEDDGGSGG